MKNNDTNKTPLFETFEGGCRIAFNDIWSGRDKSLCLSPHYKDTQLGIVIDLDGCDQGADYVEVLFKSDGHCFDYDALRDICYHVLKSFSEQTVDNFVIRSPNTTSLAIFFGGYLGVSGMVYDTSEILDRMKRLNFPLKFDMEKFKSVLMHFFDNYDYSECNPLGQVWFNTLKPVAQKGKIDN